MRRLIPKELAYAERDLMDFAWNNKWLLQGVYEAEPDKLKPFQLSFDKIKGQTILNYFDDFIAGFPYYVLRGPEEEEESEKIASAIEVYSIEEIIELLHKSHTPEEREKAILYLGILMTGAFSEGLFSEFLEAFSDPNAKVRIAAIDACTYTGWVEFREVLADLKKSDTDEEVRSRAEAVLRAMEMTEEERVAVVKTMRGEAVN